MILARVHAAVGWTSLVVFLATGLYMRSIFPEAYGDDTAVRFLFRANHVYILFASLLNIVFSLLGEAACRHPFPGRLGSCLILAAPFLFILAFFIEVVPPFPSRPVTLIAAFASLGGVALTWFSRR